MVVIENHHEPIIDRELWNIVRAEMEKRNIHGKLGTGHSNRYVFSGKIKCGACGASFASRKKYRKDGSVYKRWGCYTAAHEGRKHLDVQGNEVGCDIGKMIRDDLAMDMLKTSLQSVQMDTKWIINNVTSLAVEAIHASEEGSTDSAEQLEYEINQITKKKEDVLDSFFAKEITKEEMRMMNERYDNQLTELNERLDAVRTREKMRYDTSQLQEDVRKQVTDIVSCKTDSEVFYKNLLDKMVVYPDSRVELKLNLLPQKWVFVIGQLRDLVSTGIHSNPALPTSFNTAIHILFGAANL